MATSYNAYGRPSQYPSSTHYSPYQTPPQSPQSPESDRYSPAPIPGHYERQSSQPAGPSSSSSPASAYSPSSPRFHRGYDDLDSPRNTLPQKYLCLHPGCGSKFSRSADLVRHITIVHNAAALQRVDCEVPGCRRTGKDGFTRRDKMVDHLRDVHKLDRPKRKMVDHGRDVPMLDRPKRKFSRGERCVML